MAIRVLFYEYDLPAEIKIDGDVAFVTVLITCQNNRPYRWYIAVYCNPIAFHSKLGQPTIALLCVPYQVIV